jgi:hypothetical protein
MYNKTAASQDTERSSRSVAHSLAPKGAAPAGAFLQRKSVAQLSNCKPVQRMLEEEEDWAHFPPINAAPAPAIVAPAPAPAAAIVAPAPAAIIAPAPAAAVVAAAPAAPVMVALAAAPVAPPAIAVAMGNYARSNQQMQTDGLYNCIAVAAFHQATGFAAFTHYDTSAAFADEPIPDTEDEWGNPFTRSVASEDNLTALRARLLQELGQNQNVTYYISLGVVWQPARNADDPRMMNELIAALNAVFVPQQLEDTGRLTASWSPVTRTIT